MHMYIYIYICVCVCVNVNANGAEVNAISTHNTNDTKHYIVMTANSVKERYRTTPNIFKTKKQFSH